MQDEQNTTVDACVLMFVQCYTDECYHASRATIKTYIYPKHYTNSSEWIVIHSQTSLNNTNKRLLSIFDSESADVNEANKDAKQICSWMNVEVWDHLRGLCTWLDRYAFQCQKCCTRKWTCPWNSYNAWSDCDTCLQAMSKEEGDLKGTMYSAPLCHYWISDSYWSDKQIS